MKLLFALFLRTPPQDNVSRLKRLTLSRMNVKKNDAISSLYAIILTDKGIDKAI